MSDDRMTVRVGEENANRMDDVENKSEVVREALRQYFEGVEEAEGLTDGQQRALGALIQQSNTENRLGVERAKSVAAQAAQVQKRFVKDSIFTRLNAAGYLRVDRSWNAVYVQVRDSPSAPWNPLYPRREGPDTPATDDVVDEADEAILRGDYEQGREVDAR